MPDDKKSFDPQCAELAVEFLTDAGLNETMTDEEFETAGDALAQEIQDTIEAFIANLGNKGESDEEDEEGDEDDEDEEDEEGDEEDEETLS